MEVTKYSYMILSKEIGGNIIFVEFRDKLVVDLEIAKELVANRIEFTSNKGYYCLIDFSNIKQVTQEAKQYMQDPETGFKNILCSAFIASNPVSALLANVFAKAPKLIPSRFFYNKTDALRWIKEVQQLALKK
jgi:hypothetical protein